METELNFDEQSRWPQLPQKFHLTNNHANPTKNHADGPQLLGTVASGSAARTHGGPIMAIMAVDATRNGIGMVGLVADNAMVIEAATTETIIKATTQRRPEARDIFVLTLRKMALLRAKAGQHSTTGRKMSIWTQTGLLMHGHGTTPMFLKWVKLTFCLKLLLLLSLKIPRGLLLVRQPWRIWCSMLGGLTILL